MAKRVILFPLLRAGFHISALSSAAASYVTPPLPITLVTKRVPLIFARSCGFPHFGVRDYPSASTSKAHVAELRREIVRLIEGSDESRQEKMPMGPQKVL